CAGPCRPGSPWVTAATSHGSSAPPSARPARAPAGSNRSGNSWGAGTVGTALRHGSGCFSSVFPSLCRSRQPVPTVPTEQPPFPPTHPGHLPGVVSRTDHGRRSTLCGNWEPGTNFDLNSCPTKDLRGSHRVGTGGNRCWGSMVRTAERVAALDSPDVGGSQQP